MIQKLKCACIAFISILTDRTHIFINNDIHSIDGTMEDIFALVDCVEDILEDDLNEQMLIADVKEILNEKDR